MTIRYSVRAHATDPGLPAEDECTWSELLDTVQATRFDRASKLEGPLFSPATFDGVGKKAENVTSIQFGVLDLDDVTPDQLAEIAQKADLHDSLIFTTWKHPEAIAKGLIRARLVFPFTRPVQPLEWPALWPRLSAYWGVNDPACKDAGRWYFYPGTTPGGAYECWRLGSPGLPAFDVDACLLTEGPAALPSVEFSANDQVSERMLTHYAAHLERKAHPKAGLFRSALAGHILAAAGSRDVTLFQLAVLLAERFPTANAADLADRFQCSISHMGPEFSPAVLADKIARVQRDQHANLVREQIEALNDHALRCSQAFARVGERDRRTPYTQAEIAEYNIPKKRWILAHDASYYFALAGEYVGPAGRATAPVMAIECLAPASTAGVTTHVDGTAKPLEMLLDEYGTAINDVAYSFAATETSFDGDRLVLTLPAAPRRALTAMRDPVVEEWLELMTSSPEEHERLLDWIAGLLRLDLPMPGLLFWKAPSGVGKNLLLNGLAQLWEHGAPTPGNKVFDATFTSELRMCPLVYCDERWPTNHRGEPVFDELKEFLTAVRMPISRKYLPDAQLIGCPRLVISMNNDALKSTGRHFTEHDIHAMGDRLVHVRPRDAARARLMRMGTYEQIDGHMVGRYAIARHALWLAANRRLEIGARGAVRGNAHQTMLEVTTAAGVTWPVYRFLLRALLWSVPSTKPSVREVVRVHSDGRLVVHTPRVGDLWALVMGSSSQRMSEQSLSRAMQSVTVPGKAGRVKIGASGGGVDSRNVYRAVRVDQLIRWAETNDEADAATILAALEAEKSLALGVPASTVN